MAKQASKTADVLIVGGGIIGCSIAWRLARAGSQVTVVDRSAPGLEASSAAAGMLAPFGEMVEPPAFAELCIASRKLYPQFAADIELKSGQNSGYRSDGSLLVALDAEREKELVHTHQQRQAQGFPMAWLGAAEVHARVPRLSPEIRGGLFVPDDHWVDNERLMRALVEACRRAGVHIETGRAVRTFRAQAGKITGVEAEGGARFAAATYVLAAGCWSGEVDGDLNFKLPVAPCRGQMMEFEATHELPLVVRDANHYLVPRSGRRILAGTTVERTGFEKAVTVEGMLSILEGVKRLAPSVCDCRFLRAWAGLRPDTADHLPILGYGEAPNLVFATGHFRNGILLAPLTAEIVADLILEGATSHPIQAYSPQRFS